MNIVVIDADPKSHDSIAKCFTTLCPGSELMDFYDPLLALKYGVNNRVDVLAVQPKMRLPLVSSIVQNMRQTNPNLIYLLFSEMRLRRKNDLSDMPDAVIQLPITEEGRCRILEAIGKNDPTGRSEEET